MRKACLFLSNQSYLLENKVFDLNPVKNNHEATDNFRLLRERFRARGVELSTQDRCLPEEAEFVLFFSLKNGFLPPPGSASYLIRLESEIISPWEWAPEVRNRFQKVFTWQDEQVDGDKFIKINYSMQSPKAVRTGTAHKTGFCALVAGNKTAQHPKELYSERVKTIRWFEKHHPETFDLYGQGWEQGQAPQVPEFLRFSTAERLFRRLKSRPFPSFRGSVDSKVETLEKYRFAICYENAREIPGYITEKLFDCLYAGCIPVYWGPDNILDHIPEGVFIDRRQFRNHGELYRYLKGIDDREYETYQQKMQNFLHSEQFRPFTPEAFAETIVSEILGRVPLEEVI